MNGTTAPTIVERGDPALDSAAFRRCLGEFATGVTIITTQAGDLRAGVTANSFSSLSLDPPLILWSIGRSSRSLEAFQKGTHFAINILSLDQVKVSQLFASKETDKFAHVAWEAGIGGSPLIDGALASFECETSAIHDAGDHLLLIGHVKRFTRREGRGLLFVQGRYGAAGDHPDLEAPQGAAAGQAPLSDDGLPFTTLLAQTHHVFESNFEEHRQAEGVTLTENKVLVGLFDQPPVSLDGLAKRIYFGRRELEDAVGALLERGFVISKDGMLSLTPAGRDKRIAVMRRVREIDRQRLNELSPQDIATTEKVLHKLQELSMRPAAA